MGQVNVQAMVGSQALAQAQKPASKVIAAVLDRIEGALPASVARSCKKHLKRIMAIGSSTMICLCVCSLFALDPVQQVAIACSSTVDNAIFAATVDEDEVFASKSDYASMDSDEQAIYKRLFVAATLEKDHVDFDYGDPGQIAEVYERMRYDSPELFYISSQADISATVAKGAASERQVCRLSFTYSCGKEKRAEYAYAIKNAVKTCLQDVDAEASDAEKASVIQKSLDDIVEYGSYAALDANSQSCDPAHTTVGALLQHRAVDEGYAQAYTLLCRSAGVECRTVVQEGEEDGGESASLVRNAVNTEDGWRYIDAPLVA